MDYLNKKIECFGKIVQFHNQMDQFCRTLDWNLERSTDHRNLNLSRELRSNFKTILPHVQKIQDIVYKEKNFATFFRNHIADEVRRAKDALWIIVCFWDQIWRQDLNSSQDLTESLDEAYSLLTSLCQVLADGGHMKKNYAVPLPGDMWKWQYFRKLTLISRGHV